MWGLGSSSQEAEQQGVTSQIVDLILDQAIVEGASDVHLEPELAGKKLRVRYRIDGVLHERLVIDNNVVHCPLHFGILLFQFLQRFLETAHQPTPLILPILFIVYFIKIIKALQLEIC